MYQTSGRQNGYVAAHFNSVCPTQNYDPCLVSPVWDAASGNHISRQEGE